jgi:tripartite-type tricarboxylate transporter receptor subunit TctC
MKFSSKKATCALAASLLVTLSMTTASQAQWQPQRPVEFIVTAGAGGGTDIFARTVQSVIQKHNLMAQPVIVQIKGGGSGAEGYTYIKSAEGDPHKIVFGTHNSYALPLGSKVAFSHNDFTPVAAMAFDEFVLWVKADSPIKTAAEFVAAAKAKGDNHKMAGAQSKDSDELLTKLIDKAAGTKMIYVPFKSGSEADTQLSGGHVDSHVNNPSESVGNWRAGRVRPLCVFNPGRLAAGPKVTADQGWADIPSCKDSGIAVDSFTQPRVVWMPGKVPAEAAKFYVDLMKKVSETPEWKEYIDRTSQTARYMGGADFKAYVDKDHTRMQAVFAEQGWLVK